MRTNGALASAIGLLALIAAPSMSRAAIVETIINTDFDAVVGSISFPDFIGSSAMGVLFSYDGFSHFTQSDITSISWAVNPSTLAVTALDLSALQGTPGCGFGQNCSENTLHLSATLAQESSKFCGTSGRLSFCGIALIPDADVAFQAPSPVPEPSTWAMMLIGFAGLGFIGYRARRRRIELRCLPSGPGATTPARLSARDRCEKD